MMDKGSNININVCYFTEYPTWKEPITIIKSNSSTLFITEWGWQGLLEVICSNHLHMERHLEQITRHHIWPSFECLHRLKYHNLHMPSALAFSHLGSNNVFPYIRMKFLMLHFAHLSSLYILLPVIYIHTLRRFSLWFFLSASPHVRGVSVSWSSSWPFTGISPVHPYLSYWGAHNWTHHSRYDLTSAEQRKKGSPPSNLLATFLLMLIVAHLNFPLSTNNEDMLCLIIT